MSSFLLVALLISSNPCMTTTDSRAVARSVTNGQFHTYLKQNVDLPLGIYERITLKNSPGLLTILQKMPPIVATRPDGKSTLRAVDLIVDGAYYAKGCVRGRLAKKVSFKALSVLFKRAQTAKTPLLRRSFSSYALFFLGVWLADPREMSGPGTRLSMFLKAHSPKSPSMLKGYVWYQLKNGARYPMSVKPFPRIPQGTDKIIIFSFGAAYSVHLPWPMKRGVLYPDFLKKLAGPQK